jgi:pimeloyl-ACP methyl ester carboxylesterase
MDWCWVQSERLHHFPTHAILKTISITTEQGNFHAHLLGERGAWVVCWPAQLTDYQSMLTFAQLLARQHRVILCDPPAVGANQHLPYSDDFNRMLHYAKRVLSHFGIEQCHWVGHSAGGVVGAGMRVVSPARIQSLTLASAPMLGQGRFKLTQAAFKKLLAGYSWGRRVLVSRGVEQVGYCNAQEKKLITTYLLSFFERTPPDTIRSMRTLNSSVVRGVFDRLLASPPPMLVLCGRQDLVVLPRDQRTVAEITQAQFVDLPCGHMSLLAEPEQCASAFERFIQSRSASMPEPEALAA